MFINSFVKYSSTLKVPAVSKLATQYITKYRIFKKLSNVLKSY